MALKIYGVARSRAFRVLWMAKELGLDYEHVKVDFATGETRAPAHLALNPNGHVPVIDDDGFVLWESMAINLYLAKKYGAGGLYPTRLGDEARAWQWSFWGMTEVERSVLTAFLHAAQTCSEIASPSPTSTSPAFSLGHGRHKSTWRPSRGSPNGSKTAPSDRPPVPPGRCSGNKFRKQVGRKQWPIRD